MFEICSDLSKIGLKIYCFCQYLKKAKWSNYFISGKQFQKGQMATLPSIPQSIAKILLLLFRVIKTCWTKTMKNVWSFFIPFSKYQLFLSHYLWPSESKYNRLELFKLFKNIKMDFSIVIHPFFIYSFKGLQ